MVMGILLLGLIDSNQIDLQQSRNIDVTNFFHYICPVYTLDHIISVNSQMFGCEI